MIICGCGNAIAGQPNQSPTCRRCGQVASLRGGSPVPAIAVELFDYSPLATGRRAICEPCDHRIGETCGLLRAQGKPGHLWHPRGLSNPSSHCPDNRWNATP